MDRVSITIELVRILNPMPCSWVGLEQHTAYVFHKDIIQYAR